MKHLWLDLLMVACVPLTIGLFVLWFYWYPFDALIISGFVVFIAIMWFQVKKVLW